MFKQALIVVCTLLFMAYGFYALGVLGQHLMGAH